MIKANDDRMIGHLLCQKQSKIMSKLWERLTKRAGDEALIPSQSDAKGTVLYADFEECIRLVLVTVLVARFDALLYAASAKQSLA